MTAAGVGALAGARAWARQRRKIDLRDQVALITGGGRGLGLILARDLVREGARVAICARDADELDRARLDLEKQGAGDVFTVVCDVTAKGQVVDMVAQVRERFGRIDVLINNAGTIIVGPAEEMTDADYEDALNLHFWAAFYTTQAVLPEMRARRSGRIVNIASFGGKVASPHLLPYSTSKFALVGFSEGLRSEVVKDNVYVTTVCPGPIRTGSPDHALFKGQNEKEYAWFALSDSLPVFSKSADATAAEIIGALKYGDPELVAGVVAKLGVTLHNWLPGPWADVMALMGRMMPGPGGVGKARRLGAESHTRIAPSVLTALTEKAVRDNNQAE